MLPIPPPGHTGLVPDAPRTNQPTITSGEIWDIEVVGNRVYVGCLSNDAQFYVLDLEKGTKVQVIELDSPVSGSVGVGPDCVLVGTERGTLFCLGKKK